MVVAEKGAHRSSAGRLANESRDDANYVGGYCHCLRFRTYFMGIRLPAGLDRQLNYRVIQNVEKLVRRARLFRV